MAKQDYVPKRDGDRIAWAENLKLKVQTLGAGLGESPADIADVVAACDAIIGSINVVEQQKQSLQAATVNKQLQQKSSINLIRLHAQRMKLSSGYTAAAGEDLGVIGDEQTVDINTAKPTLKPFKEPAGWRLEFSLQAFFDGVNIYKKLPGAADFTFLARDTSSPYVDTGTIENGTRYCAYYVLGDTEVGQCSDEIVISI